LGVEIFIEMSITKQAVQIESLSRKNKIQKNIVGGPYSISKLLGLKNYWKKDVRTSVEVACPRWPIGDDTGRGSKETEMFSLFLFFERFSKYWILSF